MRLPFVFPGPRVRARPAPPPTPERLRELTRAVAEGRYRVPPEELAAAMLSASPRIGRSGRRG